MPVRYNLSEFRKSIRTALDLALKGEVIIIDRYGDEFKLEYIPRDILRPLGVGIPAAQPSGKVKDGNETIGMELEQITGMTLPPIVSPKKNNSLPQAEQPVDVDGMCMSPKSAETGGTHSVKFDGDDPYTICIWCGSTFDVLTGKQIK